MRSLLSRAAAARFLPLAAPAVIVLILGLSGLGGRQLWRDEHSTYWASSLPLADLRHLLHNVDIVFAPFYAFMHVWIAVFGDSVVALRLPAVLAMAAAAALVAALGKRLFGTRVGVIAGLLFAVLPSVTRFAQEARPYSFVLAMVTAATLTLVHAIDRPQPRAAWAAWRQWGPWAGYAVTVLAVGWSHLVALSVLAVHLTFVVLAACRQDRAAGRALLMRWLAATALGLIPVAPIAIKALSQTWQITWLKETDPSLPILAVRLFQSGFVATVVIALAVVGAGVLRTRSLPIVAWAVVPPLLLYFTFDLVHLFHFRYLLYTVPAWVLLAAVAIERVAQFVVAKRGPIRWAVGAAATLAMVTVVGLSVTDQLAVRQDPAANEADFKSAAAVVTVNSRPGDAIAYAGDDKGGIKSLRRAMAYELRDSAQPDDAFLAVSAQARGRFDGVEYEEPGLYLGDHRRIWLVTNAASRDAFAEMPLPRADLLRAQFTVTRTWRFTRVKVVLLERDTGPLQS